MVTKISSITVKIELAELTQTINKTKMEDVRKCSTQKIDEIVISGTSIKQLKGDLEQGETRRRNGI